MIGYGSTVPVHRASLILFQPLISSLLSSSLWPQSNRSKQCDMSCCQRAAARIVNKEEGVDKIASLDPEMFRLWHHFFCPGSVSCR
ncbi:hypothetical protein BDZ85DRAFT_118684 [Elsinoe ampelina]|uniref:Uncharacterized protein n=1 Tax=Elsinoe ampelina TaxID=302913 RepID=A0A6A6GAY1_9PEZI|nr:hypothetical protein BDZ85DRAFT_118684 [Elsinoe ampelina]